MNTIPASEIITVQMSEVIAPRVRYAVLVNRTPRYIAAWRQRKGNRDVLILPFWTGPAENVPDFRRMRSKYVAKPWYVGNFDNPAQAIKEIIQQNIETGWRLYCILDETESIRC